MPLIFRKIGAGRDLHKQNRGVRGWARIRDEFIRAIRVICGFIFSAVSAFSAVKNSRSKQKNCSICGKHALNFHLPAIRYRGRWFFVAGPAVIPAQPEPRQNGRGVLFQLWSPGNGNESSRHAIEIEGFVTTTLMSILQQ